MARVSPSVYLVLMALAIHASAPDVQDIILDFGPPDYTASRVVMGPGAVSDIADLQSNITVRRLHYLQPSVIF